MIPSSPPIGGNGGTRQRHTQHFTANTCRKCGAITLSGTIYGLQFNLEPRTLDDHTEYLALADHVPTYNLHPDNTAQRRHLEHIRRPERHPRHAQHVCNATYGTIPRPTTTTAATTPPNAAPPF